MIKIENIGKVFNSHSRNRNDVLKGVSFELPDKGLIAIYGKSGSGKTTLLNIIGGLDKQDKGKIYIDDECTSGKVDKIRNAKIGFIFQNYYLEKGYTISEIMHNQMVIAGFKDEEEISRRTTEVLKLVEMDRYKNKQGDALSGGQKQRVAIARALIKGSDVILADEPTGNLDVENTNKVMHILKEISKTQLVVIVTHELSLIEKYADSHIKLVDGELVDSKDDLEIVEYNAISNEINLDNYQKEDISVGDIDVSVYGNTNVSGDIKIISDNGSIYIKASDNVKIIDDKSEKKIVFDVEEKEEVNGKEIVKFEKSNAKHNGRLFSFKTIFKNFKGNCEEKVYSTANIFKQIFILAIAIVLMFFSFTIFEISNLTIENKTLSDTSVYVNLKNYSNIRDNVDPAKYQYIDFFNTEKSTGKFNYPGMISIANIEKSYTPKSIIEDNFNNLYGRMPKEGEILITRKLAEELKKELRLDEIQNDRSILLMKFNEKYSISGIVDGNESYVYMNLNDYINFLGVYSQIQLVDVNEYVLKGNYASVYFKTEIKASEEEIDKDKVKVVINRNSLYKMMKDTTEADYVINNVNDILKTNTSAIQIKNSKLSVEKFEITRNPMDVDIEIYVNSEIFKNIFIYISPNVDALSGGKNSNYFFEIKANSKTELTDLYKELEDKNIPTVNINSIYESQNKDIINDAKKNLLVFYCACILLSIIYFFIEKSESIKNSKEYGIFRAIGVNKSNLLFKETISTIMNNIISFTVFFIISLVLFIARYSIMNIACGEFILISLGIYFVGALIMIMISLIPYLFVLYKTPASILSRYDI